MERFDEAFVKGLALPGLDAPGQEDVWCVAAGCRWVQANTRYCFGQREEEDGAVKLFLVRWREIMNSGPAAGVKSERLAGTSQAGMSQTFFESAGVENLVRAAAAQLLGDYYRPVAFVPAESRFG